jgi:murein DD-endopeptidase MepM/ murein hydrolase activator NlpD
MKSLIIFLAFLFAFQSSTAQGEETQSLIIKLPVTLLKQGLNFQEVEIPISSRKDSSTDYASTITADYWDTAVYDPYKNTMTTFPLAIKFTDSTYAPPINRSKVITSRYGWRKGRPHRGIDIDLITGDSVVAMLDGVVRFARYSGGHGRTVIVRHYNGLETTYAHLSKIGVKANDTVSKGQYIGKGGNTGRSTGSHLHLEVKYKGQYIHPEYLFDFTEANTIRAQEVWVTREWARASYHNARRESELALYTTEDEAVANAVPQQKIYVVKRGDTLYGISRRNNVSITSLCKTNAIRRSSTLKIGQKLIIEP